MQRLLLLNRAGPSMGGYSCSLCSLPCWDLESTGATILPAGYKHKGQPSGAAYIMGGEVFCSQELLQILLLDTLPSRKITLTLDNYRISKMILSDGPVFMVLQKPEP